MNRSFSLLFLFLALTSCTLSYYYKGKDVIRSHEKAQKQVNQGISEFDKVTEFNSIVKQLRTGKESKRASLEIQSSLKECIKHRQSLIKERDKREERFRKLNLKKKKKYTNKDKKRYQEVSSFVDSFKDYEKDLKKIMDQTRIDCERPNQLVKKYDIKLLDANDLYAKFSLHKKNLVSAFKRANKSQDEFQARVEKSELKRKSEILKKLFELRKIVTVIKSEIIVLDKEIKNLKRLYGKARKIAVANGTSAHAALKRLEINVTNYNSLVKKFDKKQSEIKKLTND